MENLLSFLLSLTMIDEKPLLAHTFNWFCISCFAPQADFFSIKNLVYQGAKTAFLLFNGIKLLGTAHFVSVIKCPCNNFLSLENNQSVPTLLIFWQVFLTVWFLLYKRSPRFIALKCNDKKWNDFDYNKTIAGVRVFNTIRPNIQHLCDVQDNKEMDTILNTV